MRKLNYLPVLLLLVLSCNTNKVLVETTQGSEWEQLLDKDLSHWQPFLGVPYKNSGVPGYEEVENVRVGKPLGLSNYNDVFSVIEEEDEVVLKVTGEIFGSLMSKKAYENYHLKLQVKWGDQRWAPRQNAKHNNGLLYHSIGEAGKGLWNAWMTSLELEIEHTNFGDFITINDDGNIKVRCPAAKKGDKYYFDPDAPLIDVGWKRYDVSRCFKSQDLEKPMGEWTQLELICYEDMALHIVEGEVVMAVYQPQFYDGEKWIPMNKGKLQLQSEAAETYFKNIEIKKIDTLEKQFQEFFGRSR